MGRRFASGYIRENLVAGLLLAGPDGYSYHVMMTHEETITGIDKIHRLYIAQREYK